MTARKQPDSTSSTLSERLRSAKRIVVKLGTNVLCRPNGELAIGRVYSLIEELVDAHRSDKELILVSSGAISLGMERLRLKRRPETLDKKQACAAIGQIRLMAVYQQALEGFGIVASQILLTEDDFTDRKRYLNLRHTLNRLLELKTIPIVNENDTVSTSEIETHVDGDSQSVVFGDNDVLSALVASKLDADLLILLSDVDGLYDGNPNRDSGVQRIGLVNDITPEIEKLAQGGSERGRGGMGTKIQAAKVAMTSGTIAVIASGREPGTIGKLLAGEQLGTCFLPAKTMSGRKRWLAFATSVAGRVRVNRGARSALVDSRASLLFAGVLGLESEFSSGEIVSIVDENGSEFARGIVNYSSLDAAQLVGCHSSTVSAKVESGAPGEFIHRDNIVVL